MQKQFLVNDSVSAIEEISAKIKLNHYSSSLSICQDYQQKLFELYHLELNSNMFFNKENSQQIIKSFELLQIASLKAYCLINLNEIQKGRELLIKCLDVYPFHHLSTKRLAYAYQKEWKWELSLKLYKKILIYEPDNTQISHKVLKLEKQIKQEQNKQAYDEELEQKHSKASSGQNGHQKQHVTFGASEIIQMTSDHSDEYFAHIKNEINKLSEVKPKKSILKGSKICKTNTSLQEYPHSQQQKIEDDVKILKKTLSIKSCVTHSPPKWQSQNKQQKSTGNLKKQKKKKKCVWFSGTEQCSQNNQI